MRSCLKDVVFEGVEYDGAEIMLPPDCINDCERKGPVNVRLLVGGNWIGVGKCRVTTSGGRVVIKKWRPGVI